MTPPHNFALLLLCTIAAAKSCVTSGGGNGGGREDGVIGRRSRSHSKRVHHNSIGCHVSGECRGGRRLGVTSPLGSHLDCLAECRERVPGCTHYTFFGSRDGYGGYDGGACLTFDGCPEVDAASGCGRDGSCVSGDVACQDQKCFFTGEDDDESNV